jgi:hypothetical protein
MICPTRSLGCRRIVNLPKRFQVVSIILNA